MMYNKCKFFLKNIGGPEKGRYVLVKNSHFLSTFSTDSSGQLDILWHDGYSLGVDCAQVGILEETDQVGFAGFL